MSKDSDLNRKLASIGCGVVADHYIPFNREDIPDFLIEAYRTKDFRAVSVCNKWLELYRDIVPEVERAVLLKLSSDEVDFMRKVPPVDERKMPDYSRVVAHLKKFID